MNITAQSKTPKPISEKTRASDDLLRRELEEAGSRKVQAPSQAAFPFLKE
jgi:hypothetical protein